MKIKLITVGSRMPEWVQQGVEEYRKRLPADFELNVHEVPLAHRGKNPDLTRILDKEAEACLRAVSPQDCLVALDVQGRALSTEAMAERVGRLRDEGRSLALLVGGPDGLAPRCLQAAEQRWSLSALTFPHPIVRIVVAEQLYRVWSILQGHPYHRA